MSLPTEEKQQMVERFRLHDKDTGSPQVQVALLTQRINGLASHFQTHKKDRHSRQGLLRMVSRRRRLHAYLQGHDQPTYRHLLDVLNLRK
jgi:small subunit ribosomal protein S15